MNEPYIQDRIDDNQCFGCGRDNHQGLRIKSALLDDNTAVCEFMPSAHHSAGPPQYLNGGIIATIIDCHSICSAIGRHYREEGRKPGEGEKIWCVTGAMSLKYLKPVAIDQPVRLEARFLETGERRTEVACELYSEGQHCVSATVTAIRVPMSWLEGRQ